jgi:hypothetical protein
MLPTTEIPLTEPLEDILSDIEAESRRFSLPEPDCLRMRLLCEELLTSLKEIIANTEGCLFLEADGGDLNLHLKLLRPVEGTERDRLIRMANTAVKSQGKGLLSRISSKFVDAFLSDVSSYMPHYADGEDRDYSPTLLYEFLKDDDAADDSLNGLENRLLQSFSDGISVYAGLRYSELIVTKHLPAPGC